MKLSRDIFLFTSALIKPLSALLIRYTTSQQWYSLLRVLYPPNAYTMPWIRTDKIYTLIDHVLLLLLPTSYMST